MKSLNSDMANDQVLLYSLRDTDDVFDEKLDEALELIKAHCKQVQKKHGAGKCKLLLQLTGTNPDELCLLFKRGLAEEDMEQPNV